MCVYMTSHRMRVSRQGSSVGQSMRFIPAVSRVQISPLLPESRTPEAHRAPGVFCCPRLSLSLRNPPFPISKGSRAQGHPGPGQTGGGHSVPSPAGGNSSPRFPVRLFISGRLCENTIPVQRLFRRSARGMLSGCRAGRKLRTRIFPARVHGRPGSLPRT